MADMVDANDVISKLEKDISNKDSLVRKIKHFLSKFPDLRCYCTGSTILLSSRSANGIVDNVAFTEDDSGNIFAWPRTSIESEAIYSNPPYYHIGRKNTSGFGVVMNPTLFNAIDNDELSLKSYREIKNYLKFRPQIDYIDDKRHSEDKEDEQAT